MLVSDAEGLFGLNDGGLHVWPVRRAASSPGIKLSRPSYNTHPHNHRYSTALSSMVNVVVLFLNRSR